jgi:hypothetical protein
MTERFDAHSPVDRIDLRDVSAQLPVSRVELDVASFSENVALFVARSFILRIGRLHVPSLSLGIYEGLCWRSWLHVQ